MNLHLPSTRQRLIHQTGQGIKIMQDNILTRGDPLTLKINELIQFLFRYFI